MCREKCAKISIKVSSTELWEDVQEGGVGTSPAALSLKHWDFTMQVTWSTEYRYDRERFSHTPLCNKLVGK